MIYLNKKDKIKHLKHNDQTINEIKIKTKS